MKQEVVHESSCMTPKGKRYRISKNLSCPLAPKKKRLVGTTKCISKRRRLLDDALILSPTKVEGFFFYAIKENNVVKSSKDLFN